ncbi:MAG: phenylalanine--tRNA ligase beta subunit-related protein [Desulfobacterales bacterium]|jgi:lysyl-tRNA synthetase class 2
MTEIRIDPKIFEEYPKFRRGIVIARNMDNQGPSRELEDMLGEAIAQAAQHPVDLKADPRTATWSEAHRQFQSNPNKFPPAHCALLKRVQKPKAKIPFINKVVAIMNINSIRDIIPVGGDDVMRARGNLELRYADGSETFTPLGNPDVKERPIPGEVIYVVEESKEVMCRRWNWRNGHATRIAEDTRVIVMNIDGLGEDTEARSTVTRDRVAQMLEAHCQAEVTTTLLTSSKPTYQFDL